MEYDYDHDNPTLAHYILHLLFESTDGIYSAGEQIQGGEQSVKEAVGGGEA